MGSLVQSPHLAFSLDPVSAPSKHRVARLHRCLPLNTYVPHEDHWWECRLRKLSYPQSSGQEDQVVYEMTRNASSLQPCAFALSNDWHESSIPGWQMPLGNNGKSLCTTLLKSVKWLEWQFGQQLKVFFGINGRAPWRVESVQMTMHFRWEAIESISGNMMCPNPMPSLWKR